MKMKKMLMCLVVLVVAGSATFADIVTLQQGLNGYAGVEDVMLGAYNSNQGIHRLQVAGTPWTNSGDGFSTTLLKFNDIAANLPAGAVSTDITSAKLRLYVTDVLSGSGSGYLIRASVMNTGWTEGNGYGTVDEGWSTGFARHYRSDGDYANNPEDTWGNSGDAPNVDSGYTYYGPIGQGWNVGNATVRDFDNTDFAGVEVPESAGWIEFDVTDYVKDWVSGSVTNNGLYLYSYRTPVSVRIMSTDYTNGAVLTQSPLLEIDAVPEPATVALLSLGGLLIIKRR